LDIPKKNEEMVSLNIDILKIIVFYKKKPTFLEDFSASVKVKKQKFELKFKDEKKNEQIIDFKNPNENSIKISVEKSFKIPKK